MPKPNSITLERILKTPESTGGRIIDGYPGIPGDVICYTVELAYKQNEANVSCIPTLPSDGFKMTKRFSPKAKAAWNLEYVWDIAVHGRSYIMFHPGNTRDDTQGCILPVSTLNLLQDPPELIGGHSRVAFDRLTRHLAKADEWTLFVRDLV